MDFIFLEKLAQLAKSGDEKAKENIVLEFKPFILNLSKTTFIYGFDRQDIRNECYKALFKCLKKYDITQHRFISYATVGIKNHINELIRKSIYRRNAEGSEALTLTDNLEHYLLSDANVEDDIISNFNSKNLNNALKHLSHDELELINFVIIKENNMRTYAHWKDMCYSTATKKKRTILNKLKVLCAVCR